MSYLALIKSLNNLGLHILAISHDTQYADYAHVMHNLPIKKISLTDIPNIKNTSFNYLIDDIENYSFNDIKFLIRNFNYSKFKVYLKTNYHYGTHHEMILRGGSTLIYAANTVTIFDKKNCRVYKNRYGITKVEYNISDYRSEKISRLLAQ